MKQTRKKSRTHHSPLEILSTPSCAKCGGGSRFVGLETDPKNEAADLCTYECIVCENLQVASVPRVNGSRGRDSDRAA